MTKQLWQVARKDRWSATDLLRFTKVFEPPVPVEEIAKKLGAVVHYESDPGWTGAIQVVAGIPHIWVDKDHGTCRQRFTIAHEIGHLLLHKMEKLEKGQYRDNAKFKGGTDEVEANRFAADLLVPMWMLEKHADEWDLNVMYLKDIFEVSYTMMDICIGRLCRSGKWY